MTDSKSGDEIRQQIEDDVAKYIWPTGRLNIKENHCAQNTRDAIETERGRGIVFEAIPPAQSGFLQWENMVIRVTFGEAGRELARHHITMTQAREIGRWLLRRARNDRRAAAWHVFRQFISLRW